MYIHEIITFVCRTYVIISYVLKAFAKHCYTLIQSFATLIAYFITIPSEPQGMNSSFL